MKPMLSDREIEIIHKFLGDATTCLEWGSGWSTAYFPAQHPDITWLAVEHNGNWVKRIADSLPLNANVVWVPEDEWYVDCVKHSPTFDFIFIDGINRERCLEVAREIIDPNGAILLHDSGRREYQQFILENDGEELIGGEEPYQGYYKHRGLHLFRKKYGT